MNRLGIDDIALVLQQNRLRWYGHVLQKRWGLGEEMHGVWSTGSKTKRKTKEDLERGCQRGCQARKLNKEDAMDRSKWMKLIKDVRWSGWVLVGQCFFWYRPTWVVPDQRPLNGCVCMYVTQQAKGTGTYRAAVSLSSVREVGPTIHFALPLLQVIVTSIQRTISYVPNICISLP